MTSSLTAFAADSTGCVEDAPTATARWRRLATRAAVVGALAGGAWLLGSAFGSTSASAESVPPPSVPLAQVASATPSVTNLLPVVTQPIASTVASATTALTNTTTVANQTVTSVGAIVVNATAPLPAPISGTVAAVVGVSDQTVASVTQTLNTTVTSTTGVVTATVDGASTTVTGSLVTALSGVDQGAHALGALTPIGVGPVAAAISAPFSAAPFSAVLKGRTIGPVAVLATVGASLVVGIAGIGGAGVPTLPAPPAPGGPGAPGPVLGSSSSASNAFDRVLGRSWNAIARLTGLIVAAAVAAGCTLFYDAPPFAPD